MENVCVESFQLFYEIRGTLSGEFTLNDARNSTCGRSVASTSRLLAVLLECEMSRDGREN